MAKQLEARIVIPSFAKNTDVFLKALGRKTDAIEKFVFRQKDIMAEKGRPVVLKEINGRPKSFHRRDQVSGRSGKTQDHAYHDRHAYDTHYIFLACIF